MKQQSVTHVKHQSVKLGLMLFFTACMAVAGGEARTQEVNTLLSFEATAIEQWVDKKRKENPSNFNQAKCMRSDAFLTAPGTSCVAQQSLFFLTEVNKRRLIEQQALRRTLQVTDQKRSAASRRAEQAEASLVEAQKSIQEVTRLTARLAELERQAIDTDRKSEALTKTNQQLIEAYKSLTSQLHKGLLTSLQSDLQNDEK